MSQISCTLALSISTPALMLTCHSTFCINFQYTGCFFHWASPKSQKSKVSAGKWIISVHISYFFLLVDLNMFFWLFNLSWYFKNNFFKVAWMLQILKYHIFEGLKVVKWDDYYRPWSAYRAKLDFAPAWKSPHKPSPQEPPPQCTWPAKNRKTFPTKNCVGPPPKKIALTLGSSRKILWAHHQPAKQAPTT